MIGVFSKTTDSNVISALCVGGWDFIIVDREHGYASWEDISNHINAAHAKGKEIIVRTANSTESEISKSLDLGADGVQIPHVSNVSQLKSVVNATRFFPDGTRGVCRFVPDANFGRLNRNTFFDRALEKHLVIQIEGKEGIENIEEIVRESPPKTILFIGVYDLSQSLGQPGIVNNKIIRDEVLRITRLAKDYGLFTGTFVDDLTDAKFYKSIGIDYLAYSVDLALLTEKSNELLNEIV
jgi:4-hydroxy-2-oxoheptanedioate aldolase